MAFSRAAAAFIVDVAGIEAAEVDVRLVSLHHPLADRRELRAAVLNSAVGAVQAELDLQPEVADLFSSPDEEAVQLHHLLGRGLADDLPVLHAPESRVAIPAVQRLAIEDWDEACGGAGVGGGKQAPR